MLKFFIIISFVSIFNLHAQKKGSPLYYGINFGIIESKMEYPGNVKQTKSLYLIDGYIAGISLKKEIFRKISLLTGYSFRIYDSNIKLDDNSEVFTGHAYGYHSIPFYFDYEKQLYKEKLKGFISMGIIFSIKEHSGNNNESITVLLENQYNNSKTVISWENLSPGRLDYFYGTQVGCRYAIKNELFIELYAGYAFRFSDLRRYSITSNLDQPNEKIYEFNERGNHFNISLGIFYSLPKTSEYIKQGIKNLNRLL